MSTVYFCPSEKITDVSESAKTVLAKLVETEHVSFGVSLPVKIHPGAVGNTSFIPHDYYVGIIRYLAGTGVSPVYIETCMSGETSVGKEKEFVEHGFNEIPVVIADGKNGDDDIRVPIPTAKHLTHSLIAKKLAEADQVLVASHFKGHCMAGFGGALKMLGIGFASGRGKVLVHGNKTEFETGDTIDWDKTRLPGISKKWVQNWNPEVVTSGTVFMERVAESAWAASNGKHFLYLTFAMNIVNNCDCDGKAMTPVYKDVGIFASLDPVAVDKAVFDVLTQQIGEEPFEGTEIFPYAESLGLGSTVYDLKMVA